MRTGSFSVQPVSRLLSAGHGPAPIIHGSQRGPQDRAKALMGSGEVDQGLGKDTSWDYCFGRRPPGQNQDTPTGEQPSAGRGECGEFQRIAVPKQQSVTSLKTKRMRLWSWSRSSTNQKVCALIPSSSILHIKVPV
ncbi:unnamed protein product [Pleuronectes platessa]|uniref:Uncharacterized protein n=1 Tax=Pleuronectes platessa TaxID=8262 RepID=A0A9N7TZB1_PLEPL|nr:unnamed protein product [Pleuronectes platessa]